MTNYEKNKELLDMYAVADVPWSVKKDGEIISCVNACYADCIFDLDTCPFERLKWLQQEDKEPEIEVDWTKVPIDTPIWVRNSKRQDWIKRNFAGCIGGKACVFDEGSTSKNYNCVLPWEYAKLAEQEGEA